MFASTYCLLSGSLDLQSPNTEWSGSSFRHFEDKQNCFSNQLFEKRTVSMQHCDNSRRLDAN